MPAVITSGPPISPNMARRRGTNADVYISQPRIRPFPTPTIPSAQFWSHTLAGREKPLRDHSRRRSRCVDRQYVLRPSRV
jgi:hypothetical protein